MCASPADDNAGETANSLGFAARCKDVKNMAVANPMQQAAQLQALRAELQRLKKQPNAAHRASPAKGALPPPGAKGALPPPGQRGPAPGNAVRGGGGGKLPPGVVMFGGKSK